jgi:hypothetical protein
MKGRLNSKSGGKRMRYSIAGSPLHQRTIAGTYVVVLAWSCAPGQNAKKKGPLASAVDGTRFKMPLIIGKLSPSCSVVE